jgi:thiol:disulfide interchange protein DsbC
MTPSLKHLLLPAIALLSGALPMALPMVAQAEETLEQIKARIPGAKNAELRVTPIKGVYEVQRGAELAYVTEDGRYGLVGDLYRLADNTNLTAVRRNDVRRKLLADVPETSMLVFAPKGGAKDTKYTINVFTDVDCTYCRALHKQMDEYNRLGIRVRYLSFPRSGPDSESWIKAEQVWCAKDPKAELTSAKLGAKPLGAVCAVNPVAAQYALGQSINISGTPAIVTQYGDIIEGYLPPAALLKELQDEAKLAAN